MDWAGGGTRYRLDGQVIAATLGSGYGFNAAVALEDGEFAVIYSSHQTKGLVLRRGEVVREINRSFYHANLYEYPIALFRLPSGQAVLAHCPQNYNRLQLEDVATGKVLAEASRKKASDFFHSRLRASPDGRFLVSAGWIWNPVDVVKVFDIAKALRDKNHLDGDGIARDRDTWAEESSASFLPDGRLAAAFYGVDWQSDNAGVDQTDDVTTLRVFDSGSFQKSVVYRLPGRLGTIVAIDPRHLLALHGHPRLIDVNRGSVIERWPHLVSGTQTSSIGNPSTPPMAWDSSARRFALADEAGITVLQFH